MNTTNCVKCNGDNRILPQCECPIGTFDLGSGDCSSKILLVSLSLFLDFDQLESEIIYFLIYETSLYFSLPRMQWSPFELYQMCQSGKDDTRLRLPSKIF